MKWWFCLLVSISSVGFGCGEKHRGFKHLGRDIHLRLIQFGDEGPRASETDFLLFDISLKRHSGEPLEGELRWLHRPGPEAFGDTLIGKRIMEMKAGDSLQFLSGWRALAKGIWTVEQALSDTSRVLLSIKLRETATAEEFASRFRSFWLDPEEEDMLLEDFIQKNFKEEFRFRTGVWFRKAAIGTGDTLLSGDDCVLGYKGLFINGVEFDNTYSGKHLYISYGLPDQVIPGIQKALWRAVEGDSLEVIIPSYLAFGSSGSSSGIVPPYTPVLYRMRIIEVIKPASLTEW
jgi:FKBP-type peptidyl-prolyl cis-trans isomerase